MKFSILMTTYNRPDFLRFSLQSIRRQGIGYLDHELLILDDGTDADTARLARDPTVIEGLNVRYIKTGHRSVKRWRNMGFAANIGIQEAESPIVILTTSDVYHVGETVRPIVKAVEEDRMALGSVHAVYDDDGTLIEHLGSGNPDPAAEQAVLDKIRQGPSLPGVYPANPDMPFFLAIWREHLMQLGGYDEDFIGCASEDCDLLDRLKAIGCHYVYAPPGAEAIHLYHGRRTIRQLEADPGFAYNVQLRKTRQHDLRRNVNRAWGELIDPKAPWDGAPLHLAIWVTSRCNLSCDLCNQGITRADFPDYEMSREELAYLIASCRQRNIRFTTIELTGGEPSLWPLFEEAIVRLKRSDIADAVTFITNGHQAEKTATIANKHGLFYVVSRHQATTDQQHAHQKTGVGLLWNEGPHKAVPAEPFSGVLPSDCIQRHDMHGRVVRQLWYLAGTVWVCCMARTNARRMCEDSKLYHCPFNEDFDKHFWERRTDLPICRVCLCNKNVWDKLGCESPCSI